MTAATVADTGGGGLCVGQRGSCDLADPAPARDAAAAPWPQAPAAASAAAAGAAGLDSTPPRAVHREAEAELGADADVGWGELDRTAYAVYSSAFGMAVETAVYPLDVLKTRQQHDLRAVPRTVRSILRELWATDGARGLFRGYLANSIGSWPGHVVYYGGYEATKHLLRPPHEPGQPASKARIAVASLAAGFVADVTCMLVHAPADMVSQRLMVATFVREQDRPDKNRSVRMRDVMRDIVREEGFRGFYRGYFASVMTYAPSSAIWFCTYDVFKEYLRGRKSQMLRLVGLQEVEPRAWATGLHLVSGGVAGAAAAIFTNPLDVARTRQMCMDATNPHDKALLDRGFFHVLSWTAKREGMSGLFRGILPRLSVAIPSSAFTFATYEVAKRLALKHQEHVYD